MVMVLHLSTYLIILMLFIILSFSQARLIKKTEGISGRTLKFFVLNIFFFIVISSMVTYSLYTSILGGVLFLVFFLFQPHTGVLSFEQNVLGGLPCQFKRTILSLIKENYELTGHITGIYFGEAVKAKFYNVRELFFSYVDDLTEKTPKGGSVSSVRLAITQLSKLLKRTAVVKIFNLKILSFKRKKFSASFPARLPWILKHNPKNTQYSRVAISNIVVIYTFLKSTLLALCLCSLYFVYTIFYFKLQFLKQLSVWFVIGMLFFWLMSGFNFFLKRYQYGKFTSQIQRFWKRTNTCFWLIEGFLIMLFFYYYLNSSQEPLYMYDLSSLNQEYLISLHAIGINVILLSVIIYLMYFIMLRLNSNSWYQLNIYIAVVSVFVFFSFFIETYQFYYVISTFNERLWSFNEEENLWSIELDNPLLRTKHQYLLVCLIAKYWHFLFIFLSWVFFLIKSFERQKISYVLFGANLQNLILLYLLNLACYFQWLKWVYRRFFDLPYTWFMTNVDNKFFYRLFFEIKLLLMNLITIDVPLRMYTTIVYKSLNLWNSDSLPLWKYV